jgi:AraC-like DNA-binding protein
MEALADIPDSSKSSSPVFFRHYVPGRPLSEFVGLFWYWRGHNESYSKERLLPTGTSELVFNLGCGPPIRAGISGPHSRSIIIERTSYDELLGIHFNPGGAFPFLGFPLSDLHGLSIAASDVWGERRASQLFELICEAKTVEMKFQVLERWLLRIAKRPLNHHPAVSFAVREFQKDPGLLSSAVIAERVNLSQRRFIQLFRAEIGLTPKLFCRVQRFQEVLKMVERVRDVDWVAVALSCGYFDQSHFNHDFREFSCVNPTEYLKLRTEYLSHLQVRE